MKRAFLQRIVLIAAVSVTSVVSAAEPPIPASPQLAAKAWFLMDSDSGRILAEQNADQRLPPASLTKLMTSYVATVEINRGQIKEADLVRISEKAWRTGGSRMFLDIGKEVLDIGNRVLDTNTLLEVISFTDCEYLLKTDRLINYFDEIYFEVYIYFYKK